ncbi:hypothetical protein FisN_16Hh285 [Fistulifera solaris]|jgi:hypothetical protein|uniref:protein xylosyltransferase n=1 Tax=Fistulifera solaris TaxID=1519565 RepID=A0A1Z5KT74_FISSO|nr:hypothetical protein FisN_16Hh285 [Fistulifera solaris]|eukprot:GAX29285.1 hypothetical protein FisN_16Hh285 [Fistulifera solaris]
MTYSYLAFFCYLISATSVVAVSPDCSDRCQGSVIGGYDEEFRIFYFVQVHNERTMNDAVQLLRAIRDPLNTILIHVDLKAQQLLLSDDNVLLREMKACPCQNTIRVESKFDVAWSKWSMNLPTLWGLQVAAEEKDKWDVWINLSGDSLPVYTPSTMSRILSELPYNFVTSSACETGLLPTNVNLFPSFWHKRRHYTRDDTEPEAMIQYTDKDGMQSSKSMTVYFGSQWMILQPDFCLWLVAELTRDDSLSSRFRQFLESSGLLMTDETFIPTLIMHVDEFKNTLPQMDDIGYLLWRNQTSSSIQHIRYERMDEHVPTAFGYLWEYQRYAVPKSSNVDQPRPWGPYFLGIYDLKEIRDSGALFVRKVSDKIDYNVVDMLPVDDSSSIPRIGWPHEVEVSPKVDWEERIRTARAQRESKDKAESNQGDEIGNEL